jgi:hypothetical protein
MYMQTLMISDKSRAMGHVYSWQQRSMRLAASFPGSGGPWMCRSSAFICLQPIVCRGRLPGTLFRMAAHMDADLLVQSGRNCLRQNRKHECSHRQTACRCNLKDFLATNGRRTSVGTFERTLRILKLFGTRHFCPESHMSAIANPSNPQLDC